MLRKRADARDREVLLEFVDVAITLQVDVVDDLVDGVHLRFLGVLDGQIDAIAPLFPRSDVIADSGITDQAQRKI